MEGWQWGQLGTGLGRTWCLGGGRFLGALLRVKPVASSGTCPPRCCARLGPARVEEGDLRRALGTCDGPRGPCRSEDLTRCVRSWLWRGVVADMGFPEEWGGGRVASRRNPAGSHRDLWEQKRCVRYEPPCIAQDSVLSIVGCHWRDCWSGVHLVVSVCPIRSMLKSSRKRFGRHG